ncbi:hypothetical protein TorRG33x02_332250, partial [Trema orientale]
MENEYWKKKKDEMLKMKAAVMEFGKDQWAQFSQSARQCRARCYDSLAPSIDKLSNLSARMGSDYWSANHWHQISQSARQCKARCYESLAPSIEKLSNLSAKIDSDYSSENQCAQMSQSARQCMTLLYEYCPILSIDIDINGVTLSIDGVTLFIDN